MIQKESTDEMALRYRWIPQFALDLIRIVGIESFNREEQRTPMQWTDNENAGFCSKYVRPWLTIPPSYKKRNVEYQRKNPDSLYNCYKRFLKARNETPALNSGSIEILKLNNIPKDVLTYVRRVNNNGVKQNAYVFLNFSNKPRSFSNPAIKSKFLLSTHIGNKPINEDKIKLLPQEGIVLID
jgi:glycosidase